MTTPTLSTCTWKQWDLAFRVIVDTANGEYSSRSFRWSREVAEYHVPGRKREARPAEPATPARTSHALLKHNRQSGYRGWIDQIPYGRPWPKAQRETS